MAFLYPFLGMAYVNVFPNTSVFGSSSFYEALREMHTPSEFMAHHQSREGFFVRGKTDRGPPGTKTGKNNFRWIPY
jgi:hypothetical protein